MDRRFWKVKAKWDRPSDQCEKAVALHIGPLSLDEVWANFGDAFGRGDSLGQVYPRMPSYSTAILTWLRRMSPCQDLLIP